MAFEQATLMRRSCLAIVLLLIYVPAWGATYYVDATDGNDSNTGTATSTPWKTISKVNTSTFSPGDSILFKRGEIWRETLVPPSSGSSGYTITFSAYGTGNNPIISGANLVLEWVADGATNVWKATVPNRAYVVIFANTMGRVRTSKTELTSNNDWLWAGGILYIYSPSNPLGRVIEAGERDSAITASSKNYITIEGLTLRGSNGRTILDSGGNYWTIKNNIVELTSARAAGNSGAIAASFCTGVVIENNTVRNTTNTGIYLYSPTGCRVSNNTVTKSDTPGSDNIHMNLATNTTISNNTCDQTTATLTDKGNIITMSGTGNIVTRNTLTGGLFAITTDDNNITVSYNYSSGHNKSTSYAFGISNETQDPDNQQWYYNISNGDKNGFYGPAGPFTNMKFNNNVVYNATTTAFDMEGTVGSFSGLVINNIFYQGASQLLFNIAKPGSVTSDFNLIGPNGVETSKIFFNGIYYSTLAAYKTGTGQDTHSINSDPLFVNAGIDFRLQSSSPCIDVGTYIPLTKDFAGDSVPQGITVDVGAYEYKKNIPGIPTNLMIIN